jgi:hypothetical protein
MSAFYVLFGMVGMLVYGRALYRRWWHWRRHRDRRSFRELMEGLAFWFVSFQVFAVTVAGLLGLPRIWLVIGIAVMIGAFVAAGFVFDEEPRE